MISASPSSSSQLRRPEVRSGIFLPERFGALQCFTRARYLLSHPNFPYCP
jgi:hypothetical protein